MRATECCVETLQPCGFAVPDLRSPFECSCGSGGGGAERLSTCREASWSADSAPKRAGTMAVAGVGPEPAAAPEVVELAGVQGAALERRAASLREPRGECAAGSSASMTTSVRPSSISRSPSIDVMCGPPSHA